MADKKDPLVIEGRMHRMGKVLGFSFGPRGSDIKFFAFVDDVLKLIDGDFEYVRIFKDILNKNNFPCV